MDALQRCGKLPQVLLPWFRANKREMPWRADREPYHVWLSEIMLQQTRVEAVRSYYIRFLEALPTVQALAAAEDALLHKLWEGLGYYSRVRNLKKAAVVIMQQHGGIFPGEYGQIRALPGIGEYTAGAICSICFDQPTPAVDGNVLRVIARLTDNDTPIDLPARKREVRDMLAEIYPAAAGEFTQALMELGATVCGPNRKPDCAGCPCRGFCLGYERGTAERLPVKLPKKQRRQEERTVFIFRCDGCYGLVRRPETGLLAGLWQFPDVPGKLELPQALAEAEKMGLRVLDIHKKLERKHIFTHIQWNMTGYYLETERKNDDLIWFSPERIEAETALPTAYRQFWEERQDV